MPSSVIEREKKAYLCVSVCVLLYNTQKWCKCLALFASKSVKHVSFSCRANWDFPVGVALEFLSVSLQLLHSYQPLLWALKCFCKCYFRQRYSRYSVKYLCISVFTSCLAQMYLFQLVIGHEKQPFLIFFLSFFSSCVFFFFMCIALYGKVLYLSRPERLIRADIGTGCVKL